MQTSNAAAAPDVDGDSDTGGIPQPIVSDWEQCAVCQRLFDVAIETAVYIGATNRYAHQYCYSAARTRREARS